LLQDIYGKPPELCHVVIEEIEPDSWGLGGQSVAERRG
jgi:4-oxalocrotonate tautomerase family enzyme